MIGNISLPFEEVALTVEFIVSNYEDAQTKHLIAIREKVNPGVLDFRHSRECLLMDWNHVMAKIQGIHLLLSDSPSICELCSKSQEKITGLWKRYSDELIDFQHLGYENNVIEPPAKMGGSIL